MPYSSDHRPEASPESPPADESPRTIASARAAIDRPGARDAESVFVALGFVEDALDSFVRSNALPTLRVVSPEWSIVAGDGEPSVTVEASRFELFRTFGGRRSVEQFLALSWSGDPIPYLRIFDNSPLELRDVPLVE